MNFNFPKELTALPNWVCWRLEKVKGRDCKVPYNAKTGGKAMPNNPETWATFDEAVEAMQKYGFLGVGFIFTLESGIVGIDLDKCFDEHGNPNAIAKAILDRVGTSTYTELSPSRTGLHIFLKGTLPKGGRRNSANGVEIYSEKRYFTMTGMQYSNCVEIADDTGSLAWIHDTFIKPPKKESKAARGKVAKGTSCLADDELVKMATKSKDTDFAPLWNGSWQGKYNSQSEADMALCGKIAWWANADYRYLSIKHTIEIKKRAVCDYIGFSESAVDKLREIRKNKAEYPQSKILSDLISGDNFNVFIDRVQQFILEDVEFKVSPYINSATAFMEESLPSTTSECDAEGYAAYVGKRLISPEDMAHFYRKLSIESLERILLDLSDEYAAEEIAKPMDLPDD